MLRVKLFVMMKKKFKALNILVYIHQLHPTPFLRAHSFLRVVKMLYRNLILAKIILAGKTGPKFISITIKMKKMKIFMVVISL